MATIDNLNIEINAKATEANNAIDKLVGNLDRISTALKGLEGNNFKVLTDGIKSLNSALSSMDKGNVSAFSNIANSTKKLNEIDSAKIREISDSFSTLSNGLKDISAVTFNPETLNNVASAVSKFGYKTGSAGTENLSKLKNDLIDFVDGLNRIKTVTFNVDSLSNLIASINKLGGKASTQATTNLPNISKDLQAFISGLNGISTINFDVTGLSTLVSSISRLGGKAVTNAIGNVPLLAVALKNLMATLSTAPRVSQNIIDMTNALARLASAGGKVGNSTKSLISGLNGTSSAMNRATKSSFSLASAIGKFYAKWFLIIRGVKSLKNAIVSTTDYIEAYNYFNVAFGKIASEWSGDWEKYGYANAQDYSDSFTKRINEGLGKLSGLKVEVDAEGKGLLSESGIKNLGLNIQEITQYAAQLASVTNSIGLTGKSSLAASSAFTKLAGDISSLFNVDYSDVANNLQSALIGQARAVYKYGLDITAATLQTYAYNLGLSKSVSEMTQAEKMQLRMIAILDQSKVSWGDLANTISSPSNQLRQFTNNLKETGMVLGQLFIPLLQKVMPVINGITIAIKRLLVSIAQLLGIELNLDDFGEGYTDMEDDIDGVSDAFDDATKAAKKFQSATIGIDKLNIISPKEDDDAGAGAGAPIDLTDEILKATSEYEKAWQKAYKNMESAAQKIADKITKAFNGIGNAFKTGGLEGVGSYISNALATQLNEIDWQKIYSGAKGFGKGLASFLNGLISPELFGAVGKTIASALNTAIYTALSFGENFNFKNFGLSIATGINEFFDTFDFASLAKSINVWVQGLFNTLKTAITNIEWKDVMKGLKDFVTNLDIETVGIIIGAIAIKKVLTIKFATKALSLLGTSISKKIAQAIGSKLGLELAADAGIGVALKSGFLKLGTNLGLVIENVFSGLTVGESLTAVFGSIATTVAGVVSTVAGGILAIGNFVSMLKDGFSWIKESLMVIGVALAAVGAVILGAPALVAGIVAGIVAAVGTLVVVVKENWQAIKDRLKGVADWLSKNLVEPSVKIFKGFKDRIVAIFEGVWIIVQAVWIKVSEWFDKHVVEPTVKTFSPIVKKVGGFFSDLWDGIKKIWGKVSRWFKENIIEPVSDDFKTACDSICGFFSDLWDGIKKGVVGAMNAIISAIESGINKLADGINSALGGFNAVVSWAADIAGVDWEGVELIPQVTLPRIPQYAVGGFPEDGLFYANHNELVGQFSNGKTAVANNDQIITGIKNGVKQAMTEALASANLGGGDFTFHNEVTLDGKTIAKNTNKYNSKTGKQIFGNQSGYNFVY